MYRPFEIINSYSNHGGKMDKHSTVSANGEFEHLSRSRDDISAKDPHTKCVPVPTSDDFRPDLEGQQFSDSNQSGSKNGASDGLP